MIKIREQRVVEVARPNLMEGMFPHSIPPRIMFDGDLGNEIAKRNLRITDTTFRDGQQARPPYSVEQIVNIFNLLSKLSGPNGIISQSEFFVYSNKDKEAVLKCRGEGKDFPEITGWIRGLEADVPHLKWLAENEIKETGLLTSCSDYHIFHKLRMDRKQAFDRYKAVVERALELGVRPRCHLEDITRADIYGFVIPFVQELMKISEKVSSDLKVKVRLCDTLGFGVPYPEASLPIGIPKLVSTIRQETGIPSERLEWHGHNDFYRVHENAVTAWLYGCDNLNATLGGYGERTGNPPLEAAVIEYARLKGGFNGMDPRVITEAANYLRSIGVSIAPEKPIIGKDAFTTMAGIHADGLKKDERIYTPFDPTILAREQRISVTDKTGAEGIQAYVQRFLQEQKILGDREEIRKGMIVPIARWVEKQYDGGRNTAISDQEMAEQIVLHLGEYYPRLKELKLS